jgi:hypothetical protein
MLNQKGELAMNQFFYEQSGKEKVKNLMEEGMRSQEFHRSGAPRIALVRGVPKLIAVLLGVLGILALLVR